MKRIIWIIILVFSFSCHIQGQEVKKRVNYEKGTILSSEYCVLKDNAYYISKKPYDPNIIGVSTGNNKPLKITDLVANQGVTEVKFNDSNGKISLGDPVTSSNIPGQAMKATDSGMILGVALEDAGSNSKNMVKIRISIQYMAK
ncbi:MAG: hypothetical protein ACP5DZ_04040 [Bacteroidales bacterium]